MTKPTWTLKAGACFICTARALENHPRCLACEKKLEEKDNET